MKKILKNVIDIVEGRSPERKSSSHRHKSRRNLRESDERHPRAFDRPSQHRYREDDYDEYERDRTRSSDRRSRDWEREQERERNRHAYSHRREREREQDQEQERERERERDRQVYSHRRQSTGFITPLHENFDQDLRFHVGDHVEEAMVEQPSASEGWKRNYGVRYVRDRNGKAVRKRSFVDEYLERSDEDGLDEHDYDDDDDHRRHQSHGSGRHRDQDWASGRGRDADEYGESSEGRRRRHDDHGGSRRESSPPPPSAFAERSRPSSHTGWRYQGAFGQDDAAEYDRSNRRHRGARSGSPTASRERGRILGEVDGDD